MPSELTWFLENRPEPLTRIAEKLNSSVFGANSIEKARALFEGLNQLFKNNFFYRKRNNQLTEKEEKDGSNDNIKLKQLVNTIIPQDRQTLFQSSEFRRLMDVKPELLDHGVLQEHDYDPSDIGEDLIELASEKHCNIKRYFAKYLQKLDEGASDPSTKNLIGDLPRFLWMIRSNLQHGEKTPRGPDLNKANRDLHICGVANEFLTLLFESLLNKPSSRLAIYGTLAPGEPNHSLVKDIPATWLDGEIVGYLRTKNGLPTFDWRTDGSTVQVKVLNSESLTSNWKRLDQFEGNGYYRGFIPVKIGGDYQMCRIYLANEGV